MGEHLDFDQLAPRAADVVFLDFPMDARHLLQRQFAGQHHRVGPLREELHGFGIRYVALGRYVHLHADAAGIEYGGHVGGDDGVHALGLGAVDHFVDGGDFVFVDDRVDRQVGFQTCGMGRRDDPRQVVFREVGCRSSAHVQASDPEVDRVGAGLDRGRQRFVRPHRSHDFDIFALHFRNVAWIARLNRNAGPVRNGSSYLFRPSRPMANSRRGAVRTTSAERVSSWASARSNRSSICCSARWGTSSRS